MYIGNDLQIAHPSYKIIDDISSGFNGSQTSFALQVSGATPVPFPISTQQVMISVNGVVQEPDPNGSAGFKLLGSNIVFSSAPANGHAFFGVINAGADYVTAGSEFPDGSATAPSFTFQDDQDTGWFRSGSGDVGYSSNGAAILNFDGNGLTIAAGKGLTVDTSTLKVDAANNRVGVGTASPSCTLNVTGSNAQAAIFQTSLSSTTLSVVDSDGDGINIAGGSAYGHRILTNTTEALKLGVNNAVKLTIDSSGKVGINQTPTRELSLHSPDNNNALIHFTNDDTGETASDGIVIGLDGNENLVINNQEASKTINFHNGGSQRMQLDSSGRLLVGVTGSTSLWGVNAQLQVEGTNGDTSSLSITRNTNDAGGPYLLLSKSRGTSDGSHTIVQSGDRVGTIAFVPADGTNKGHSNAQIAVEIDGTPGVDDLPSRLLFLTTADGANSATERMRITNTGAVKIGTTIESASAATNLVVHTPLSSSNANSIEITQNTNGANKAAAGIGIAIANGGASTNAADLYFSTATNGSLGERLRIKENGALGIAGANYGTSGQVLTSGGSGAAPSWTTISAAPEITATVDGSLSANDAVIVKSTGNIEKVTKTITIANPITHSSVLTTSGNNIDSKLVHDKLTGYTVRVWWDNGSNRAGKMQALKIEAGTNNPVNVGSEVTWRNNNTYYIHAAGDGKGRVLVTYRDTGDNRSACHLMNIASDGTLTAHGSGWIGGSNSGRTYVTYVPDDDLFVVLYVEGTSMYAKTVTVQANGTSISVGSASSQIDSGYFDNPYGELLHYDEFSNKLVACGWKSSYLRAISGTVSGTNTSWNSGVNIGGNGNSNTQGNYDCLCGEPDTGLMLSAFKRGSNYSSYGGAIAFKVNGNGFTAGSENNLTSAAAEPAGIEYHPGIGRLCVAYSQASPATWSTRTVVINSSSLAYTLGTAEELTGTHNYAREGSMVYDVAKQRMIILGRHGSNNSQRVISAYYGATTTNMTVDNFIGFSADSYSNGNTGTVKVTGNTSTHSSLTPGQKYYVQIDNTLATTADSPSVEAGIALSSTKLLIKG